MNEKIPNWVAALLMLVFLVLGGVLGFFAGRIYEAMEALKEQTRMMIRK